METTGRRGLVKLTQVLYGLPFLRPVMRKFVLIENAGEVAFYQLEGAEAVPSQPYSLWVDKGVIHDEVIGLLEGGNASHERFASYADALPPRASLSHLYVKGDFRDDVLTTLNAAGRLHMLEGTALHVRRKHISELPASRGCLMLLLRW